MKVNKWIFISSLIITVLSLGLYLIFHFCCTPACDIGKDISMAVFGSSFFVVMSALIGYFSEKSRLKSNIIANNNFSLGAYFLTGIKGNNSIDRQGFAFMITSSRNSLMTLRGYLADYYKGCFFKNKELKEFLNEKALAYYKNLSKFEQYLAAPTPKNDVIERKFWALVEESGNLSDELFDWMKKAKFVLGEGFDFGKNFIVDYESEEQK